MKEMYIETSIEKALSITDLRSEFFSYLGRCSCSLTETRSDIGITEIVKKIYVLTPYDLVPMVRRRRSQRITRRDKLNGGLIQVEQEMLRKYMMLKLILNVGEDMDILWIVYNVPGNEEKFENLNRESKFMKERTKESVVGSEKVNVLQDKHVFKIPHITNLYDICGISNRKDKVISRNKFK